MILRPKDTDPQAWSEYQAVLDRMDGSARFQAAVELSDAVRELRLAGIRTRHPELDERGIVALLVEEDYGVRIPLAT
jgi:hypothetical protein